MSERYLTATFDEEDELMSAVRELRMRGYTPSDVYGPYPIHGLDALLGIRRSRLGLVCAIAGFGGAALALWFQSWTSASSWPLNVGGKPMLSIPAFIPVTFEIGVLFGGLATVLALFVRSGLYPGKKIALLDRRITDDRFVVVFEEEDSTFGREEVAGVCEKHGAVEVAERVDRGAR